jgi:hypothetical protein
VFADDEMFKNPSEESKNDEKNQKGQESPHFI